jgi:pimeloyl-ACP methyl ester carboxylesterase
MDAGTSSINSAFPVLLIHGYASTSLVWERWETLLKNDNITAEAVTFADNPDTPDLNEDACGSAADHSKELNDKVKDFKNVTGTERINIVAHSKGGLDARVYLANNLSNTDIANLIMVGTPSAGSPLAYVNELCSPAIFDLRPGSDPTKATMNNNTKYYTIAGHWTPAFIANFNQYPLDLHFVADPNCSSGGLPFLHFQRGGSLVMFVEPNDGIVPLSSAQPMGEFMPLGVSDNCHTDLLGKEEYELASRVLLKK